MKKNRSDWMDRMAGVAVLLTMITLMSAAASGQCFGSYASLVAAASSLKATPVIAAPPARAEAGQGTLARPPENDGRPSIVGFWHVHYLFPDMDQEAYQTFETGGTEIHNPNTPTDGVCLGSWANDRNAVKLTHRVWLYDNGVFVGVGHLNANIKLTDHGNGQTGTFTLQIFDLNGNAVTPPIPGTLSGERITPD